MQKIKDLVEQLQKAVIAEGITQSFLVHLFPVAKDMHSAGVLIGAGIASRTKSHIPSILDIVEYCGFGATVDEAFSALRQNVEVDLVKANELDRLTK